MSTLLFALYTILSAAQPKLSQEHFRVLRTHSHAHHNKKGPLRNAEGLLAEKGGFEPPVTFRATAV